MKTSILKAHFLAAGFLALALAPARAQTSPNLSLRWFTVDSGGGLSTNGIYALQSTIGQPDADLSKRLLVAEATAADFQSASERGELYWLGGYPPGALAFLAAPRLDVRRDGMTTVVLSWQVSPIDFFVMGTTNLHAPGDEWQFLFTDELERAGDNWEMNLRTIGPARYFRLIPAWLTKK